MLTSHDILYKDMLNEDIPLPKPEKMTLGQITSELELRGLSTTGSRSELNGRLTQDDLSKAIDYLLKKTLICIHVIVLLLDFYMHVFCQI